MTAIRTPPSLKWLIDKRARLLGELTKLNKRQAQRLADLDRTVALAKSEYETAIALQARGKKQLAREKQTIAAHLRAIDIAMSMHEIQIDPNKIPEILSQEAVRYQRYGEMTRGIYSTLKSANGAPLSALEIAMALEASFGLQLSKSEFQDFRHRIRQRLKYLCWSGKLRRIHQAKTQLEGRWTLPDQAASAD